MKKVKINVWKGKKDNNIHLSTKDDITYVPTETPIEKFFKKQQKIK